MISINRLEEMAIEELQTELKNFKEQIKLQNNFIESLLKATNNSEWLNKTILDDEASEIIEKIGMDYIEFEEGKEINAELKAENEELKNRVAELSLFQLYKIQRDEAEKALTEIKEIAEKAREDLYTSDSIIYADDDLREILQKISECGVER